MDFIAVLGFVGGLLSLVLGFTAEGGHIQALLQPTAALIVFGGTLGATILSFSSAEIVKLPKLIRVAFTTKPVDPSEVIEVIVNLADEARREGLLYLENRLDEMPDPFLRKGVQLVVDGTDPELVRSIMEVELYAFQERREVGASVFEAAGGYAPTMGIIGTVMGLIHVLGNVSDPENLGPAIALAFVATLYGVCSANIFWLPLASKLKGLSHKETLLRELMLEGIVSLQAGYNPVLIRERLTAFLVPDKRGAERELEEEE